MRVLAVWWTCAVTALVTAPRAGLAISLYDAHSIRADVGGDVKVFLLGVVPYKHALLPSDPSARALLDLRLKLNVTVGQWLKVVVHPDSITSAGPATGLLGMSAAARLADPPEAVSLSRVFVNVPGFNTRLRTDRAHVTLHLPHLDVTAGRQPITFGSTFFFTPMDVVAPFSPLIVDREYKPGVDALRADVYMGTSTTLTVVAAYTGAWSVEGTVVAARAGTTLGTVDVGVFGGVVRGDSVVGADVSGGVAGLGVRGEATLTVPRRVEDTFLRAALGLDKRFANGLSLSGEVYLQSFGALDPQHYLDVAQSPRVARGEVWALGRLYSAMSLGFEVLPVLTVGMSTIVNVLDASALLGPTLTWSIADEVVLVAGGFASAGARPDDRPGMDPARPLVLRSEFGSSPNSIFVQLKAYF
jgi:hypothetical protein